MEQAIIDVKDYLAKLEEVYELEQARIYKNKDHKQFAVGDWVTDGCQVGVVGWTANKACNCLEEDGYMGVDLKNGNLGFHAFVKRDEWNLLPQDKLDVYVNERTINLGITGEEMKALVYYLGYSNPSNIKTKVLNLLNESFPEFAKQEQKNE